MLDEKIKKLEDEISVETLRKKRREEAVVALQKQLQSNLRTLWQRQLKGPGFDLAKTLINRDTNSIERLQGEIATLKENIAIKEIELAAKLITKIYKSPFIFLCDKRRMENFNDNQKENISTIVYYSSTGI